MRSGPEAQRPALRRGLHRRVVDELGQRIVGGELPPGTVLRSENELALELDVSRTVVREAARVLAAKGLVESRPRTGTRVLPRSHWVHLDPDVMEWTVNAGPNEGFYRDLFEVRALIEVPAAGLAAQRRSEDEMGAIESMLERMATSVSDTRAYIEADLMFHSTILLAAHNELLEPITSTLSIALEAGRAITTRIPGGKASSIPLHRAVSEAIRRADSAAARDAMQELITFATKDMELVLGASPAIERSDRRAVASSVA